VVETGNFFSRNLVELRQNCKFVDLIQIMKIEKQTNSRSWQLQKLKTQIENKLDPK